MFLRLAGALGVCSIGALSYWNAEAVARPPSGPHVDLFTSSEQCAVCHTNGPGANAMHSRTGDEVSPYGTWQGTMMANAFRDPYFRAQLQKETSAAGEVVQELCLRCHTPMVSHGAMLAGDKPPRLADVEGDLFADDGVSCTVCHMMDGKNFGDASSFSGHPSFNTERRIFGPFPDPLTNPMQNFVRYTPTQGVHVRQAGLCGTCHTLFTEHHGTPFPEQSPYLEWRNSDFNDENGRDEGTRTCQECHMADTGATRIARSPMGFDFDIKVRDGYRAHAFVGGNAFMLDLLQSYRDDLDVTAEPEALARMAAATRRQLGESTARLAISAIEHADGVAKFSVKVENLAGHKFPTGYPARRAWLHVEVRQGRQLVFESGAVGDDGRLVGVADEHRLPHVRTVEKPGDVVVYEMVASDSDGAPTTYLTRMQKRQKDNRLLPSGWRADGPHVADTAPQGVDGDEDFVGGSDTVAFRVALPARGRGRLQVRATLYYQPVPPLWVDSLRSIDAEEAKAFVRMYDAADKTPDTVATAARVER
ncbi:MAG TPA: hypothetical protein VFZ65_21425 [Planctomycetota bacterium]|nr:hypothetical protein [Planctomycetota bacterium]